MHSEYRTYQENKEVKGFKASAVNDMRCVYLFGGKCLLLARRQPNTTV